jgi:hypothetical protein
MAKSPGFAPPTAMLEKLTVVGLTFVTVIVAGLVVFGMPSFPNAR